MNNSQTREHLTKLEIPVAELKNKNHPSNLQHRENIAKYYKEGVISEVQINAISSMAPHLVDLAKGVSESAQKSQKEGFFVHKNTAESAFKAQEKISENAKTEETFRHISDNLKKMNSDNNESQRKMNSDNNSMYAKIAVGIGGLLLSASAAAAGIFFSKK